MKLMLSLLVLALLCATGIISAESIEPTWHTDWPTAQRIARRENRPLFVVMACKH